MIKHVMVAAAMLAGCKGDKCERMFDKLEGGLEKDLGHAPDKDKMIGECRAGLAKHPESAKMLDCVLAISGEPSREDMQKCMDPDDKRTPAAAKQLNRIAKSAKAAFATNGEFPKGKVGLSPGKECCAASLDAKLTGTDAGKCPADAAAWKDPVWTALAFSVDEPSLYRYSYESDGKTFTALAVGDADCDTKMATFTLTGHVDNGTPKADLVPPAKGAY
jgi:hypothetical protein